MEYDFIVEPQADPKQIALSFEGISRTQISANGELILVTNAGELRQHRPLIYQLDADDKRKEVSGGYFIDKDNRISFKIGDYDASKPLIIDPVLEYSTYLGGTHGDVGVGIAVDATGSAYITGTATSPEFPISSAFQLNRGDLFYEDVFVSKLSPDGSRLLYSTFVGGVYGDDPQGIAIDKDGSVYVTGITGSPDYPTTTGVVQRRHAGTNPTDENQQNDDAFVTKLTNQGSLVYSTFLGGAVDDAGWGIAADSNGNAYVVGSTRSADFLTTSNAFQTNPTPLGSGYSSGFLAKLSADGSQLLYSTYYGGATLWSVAALDSSAFVASSVSITKFNTNAAGAASRVYASLLAGGFSVAVDSSGSAYVGANPVVKLNEAGSSVVWSKSVSGTVFGIALDSKNNAYVAGNKVTGFNSDAFVSKLKEEDGQVIYTKVLGGSQDDFGYAIAVDPAGSAYVTGGTKSANFPTTAAAFQPQFPPSSGGNHINAYAAKIHEPQNPLIFIPGLMGSYLDNLHPDGTRLNIWPGDCSQWINTLRTGHSPLTLKPGERHPVNIIASDAIRSTTLCRMAMSPYESILNFLTQQAGYREYQVNNDPQRRSKNGV